ncbi:efflux RND transporter periplasmic adaptor subunit [Aequoribacter sp.]|uniref:efflux RND transporter periplasmic adaptor subunit n=1 Tax=Aequoribacter sp. TaxID=2847771 RepID=UPI003F69D04B
MRGLNSMVNFLGPYGLILSWALLIAPSAGAQDSELGGRLRVSVAPATETTLTERRSTTGVVRAWRTATVSAEIPGRVRERHVEPGYFAAQEENLISVDPRRVNAALRSAQATLAAQRVNVADAEQDLERTLSLLAKGAVSQDVVDDRRFDLQRANAQLEITAAALEDAQRQAADVDTKAPFAGKIETVYVQVGDYVSTGTPVAAISDFSKVRIITGVSSRDISRIAWGETAQIILPDLGGLELPAKVSSVGSIKDARSGNFPVELVLDTGPLTRLRDGLVATVTWGAGMDKAELTIPTSAILRRDGRIVAYTVRDGIATERQITTGRSNAERVVIHEGINLGDHVVIEGHFALRDGARVDVVYERRPGDDR